MTRGRYLLPLIAAVLVLSSPATAVAAGPLVDRAVSCFESESVCVDPAARDILSPSQDRALERRVDESGAEPIFIAVLPEGALAEANGSARGLVEEIHSGVRRSGTYAVVAGSTLLAADTDPAFPAAPLADDAVRDNRGEGADAVLGQFVDSVGEARAEGVSGSSDSGSGGGGEGSSGLAVLALFGVLGLGVGAVALTSRRQRRKQEQQQLEEVKRDARDDLVALGDDIRALELDVEMPGADPAAKADYGRAVELYEQANQGFSTAQRPEDLGPVAQTLEEGRFAMTSARARLAGEQPPERRPPCFFDPRHGPSVTDVEWAPPGGAPRPVPACAADAQRIHDGYDPHVREVTVDGMRTPYYNAPAYYGPWAGGFYGGFGGLGTGLLGGMLIGSMLGGWGGHDVYVDADGGGWGDGGGNLGGGDFGGGDFGGGGFGGDFGGGDF